MLARNRALAHRYFTEILAGEVDAATEVIAEDVIFIGPSYWGEVVQGRDGFTSFIRALRAAFPDLSFAIEDEVADETRVVTRFRMTGTHQGQWLAFAATGRAIALPGVDIFRIENGRIAEIRVFYDTLGLLQQLGVVPLPDATMATP